MKEYQPEPGSPSCFGYCRACGGVHELPYGRSVEKAREVMAEFEEIGRIDYLVDEEQADPELDFSRLLPGDRGHMFGVMECLDPSGSTVWLRAFSSLGTGVREVDGWAPYILDRDDFEKVLLPGQVEIKRLTRKRNALAPADPLRESIEIERREISRDLMPRIHDLYRFRNFRGEVRALRDVFEGDGGIPAGVGDCCAPKLLNQAVTLGLKPVSVAEFYWGGENRSGRKKPGQFFQACEEKCQPILGFLLCGL